MKKKLLMLIGGSVLSAILLAGCNVNDDQNPPPENDADVQDQDVNDDNGVNDNVDNDADINGDADLNGDNNGNDLNPLNGGDDENTEQDGEDPIEDPQDINDADNKDE